MKKIIEKIEAIVGGIPADKALHFIAGMLIAAIVAIVVPQVRSFSFVVAFAAGLGKELIDEIRYNGFDNRDLISSALGGVVMQIIIWLL